MVTVNPDGKIMVRRCLVTLRPFRLFVLGIGFFSLCFLMTSLGGQFSARRPGDSPFTIRTEVLGGPESRGVLRRMSDLLELMVKRMDMLARLGNSSEPHRAAGDTHFAVDRFPPGASLMERIQAIAQNVSDIAVKVDQILRHSLLLHSKVSEGRRDQCEAPSDPKFPDCLGKVEWMRARWTSDPCYAFFGVDGTECSFLVYLSEVEWFCPPLPWRNRTATQTALKPLPKVQAVFRSNLSHLLELMGSGKESLIFMKKRAKRLTAQWAVAAQRLSQKLGAVQRDQKQSPYHFMRLSLVCVYCCPPLPSEHPRPHRLPDGGVWGCVQPEGAEGRASGGDGAVGRHPGRSLRPGPRPADHGVPEGAAELCKNGICHV
uniref:alpha-1,6-mannosyl-glycoprotein 6-beta-N-acetylglucosaminyltransferase n=1 Tax=Equus caballus TaxID=9796 RepID=A0A9L0TQE5_HORSE